MTRIKNAKLMIIGLKKRVILFDKIPCNLQKATVEPEKVMAPTIPPRISAGEKYACLRLQYKRLLRRQGR